MPSEQVDPQAPPAAAPLPRVFRDAIHTRVTVVAAWPDRLPFLLTGRLHVRIVTPTENVVGWTDRSSTTVEFLTPRFGRAPPARGYLAPV